MSLVNYRNYGRLWCVYGRSLVKYSTPKKIVNAMKTEYAYRRRISDVRSAPFILFFEPLYHCNLQLPTLGLAAFPQCQKVRRGAFFAGFVRPNPQ